MPILYALATQSVATHGPVNESLLGAKKKVKKVRVTFGWELWNSTGACLSSNTTLPVGGTVPARSGSCC